MRIVFFSSGAFGLPTLQRLHARHEVAMVVSQPDRPAGRSRALSPTQVSAWAIEAGLPLERCADVHAPETAERLREAGAEAWVVIAFGQKLSDALLADRFAVNLHGSLLPRWRGAAPIHHAVMAGDDETGVSVITLSNIMDGGEVLAQATAPIAATTTTGDLYVTLAELGPDLVSGVLEAHCNGTLQGVAQRAEAITLAPKLSRSDARIAMDDTADVVRCRINGLSPWPGCTVEVAGVALRLLRADCTTDAVAPGHVRADGVLGCGTGSIQLVDVQPAGGRPMSFAQWANGRRLKGVLEVTA